MTKDEVSTRLRALATDDKRRSETARLRDVFDDVEATLNAGVTQADVLAELHALGFTMTMASFKSALQRIRKERSGDKSARRSVAPTAPLGHDQTPGDTAPAAPAAGKKAGDFEIPVPKRFTHNPKPDDDLLK
ncbi:TPA: hypothetical protein MAE81_005119 [Klebsiella pneumoniae]|nr:hypothetical protein [Salmonella enterica]HBS2905916.1 hypothetical protein [Klebsiella pneumoniae]